MHQLKTTIDPEYKTITWLTWLATSAVSICFGSKMQSFGDPKWDSGDSTMKWTCRTTTTLGTSEKSNNNPVQFVDYIAVTGGNHLSTTLRKFEGDPAAGSSEFHMTNDSSEPAAHFLYTICQDMSRWRSVLLIFSGSSMIIPGSTIPGRPPHKKKPGLGNARLGGSSANPGIRWVPSFMGVWKWSVSVQYIFQRIQRETWWKTLCSFFLTNQLKWIFQNDEKKINGILSSKFSEKPSAVSSAHHFLFGRRETSGLSASRGCPEWHVQGWSMKRCHSYIYDSYGISSGATTAHLRI